MMKFFAVLAAAAADHAAEHGDKPFRASIVKASGRRESMTINEVGEDYVKVQRDGKALPEYLLGTGIQRMHILPIPAEDGDSNVVSLQPQE